MNAGRIPRWCTLTALVALTTTIGLNQRTIAQQATAGSQDGMEVLTRGPVHEAFAETVTFDPEPGIVVAKAPPDAIEEIAPDQKPEGDNVAWIPGYWGWDDERNDFLWVSGVWRALPPGRQWMPGSWAQSPQGYQWSSGYWADAQANNIQYLPEPPATVEAGPNVAAPSADDTWLPGCWIWQQNRYAWRPGNWVAGQQDWQWVPSYYVWTPRGYVFNDGYWDYAVARRGVLFAPVYFNSNIYGQRGFSYSPSTVINPAVFASHLFLRPSYGHYYFGDYYAADYGNAGFTPWFAFQSGRSGYDPFFAQERWQHRRDRDWENRTAENFRNFRDNENARPPHTLADQSALSGNGASPNNRQVALAASLDDFSKSKNSQFRFQRVGKSDRQQLGNRGQSYRTFLAERQQLEANAGNTSSGTPGKSPELATAKLAKSPYAATIADKLGKNDAPPKRYEVMKPNLDVEPQPKKAGGNAKARTETTSTTDKNVPQGQRSGKDRGNSQDDANNQQQGSSKSPKQSGSIGQQQGVSSGQQQGGSQGKKQTGSNDQQQGRSKDKKQGQSNGQQQGTSNGQQQSGTKGQNQTGSGGQQQGGTGGQPQGSQKNQSTDESKKKDKG